MIQPIRPQDASGIYQRQAVQGTAAEEAAGGARRAGEGGRGGARRADHVSVSDDARQLHRVMGSVQSQPDVRADRVEQIRQAIADGSYEIDARAIARRLIDDGIGQ